MAAADFKGALPPAEGLGEEKERESNNGQCKRLMAEWLAAALMAAFAVAARAQGPVTLEMFDPTVIAEGQCPRGYQCLMKFMIH
jgi:hypothetical protein